MAFCFPRLFSSTTPCQRNFSLYNSCSWEDKAIRKLIADGKIAARLKGTEYCIQHTSDQECPICFLYYTEVNVTKCCNANVCTECFLQVRPQKEKLPVCPFCNSAKFTVSVAQKPSEEQLQERQKEEQTATEARRRAEQEAAMYTTSAKKKSGASVAPDSPSLSGFGSELEKDERFQLLKKRTESMASNEGIKTPQRETEMIQSFAMTPDERRRLEEEMKAQHNHPLSLRVEAEAHERRLQNEQAYYRSNSAGSNTFRAQRAADLFRSNSGAGASTSRRMRYRGGGRDWSQIVDAFERNGIQDGTPFDDLAILEAAMLLSTDEDGASDRDGEQSFANRQASAGFPCVRSLLGSTSSNNSNDGTSHTETFSDTNTTASQNAAEAALIRLNARRRRQLGRAAGIGSSARHRGLMTEATLDTANMMMRGISEEDQVAMAIAASLQEQSAASTNAHTQNEHGAGSASLEESSSSSEESTSAGSNGDAPAPPDASPPAGEQCNGDEAVTITELARVVTDSATGVGAIETDVTNSNDNLST